jgi:hypothetical protein
VARHGLHGKAVVFGGVIDAQRIRLSHIQSGWDVHEDVMGGGLVGDHIRDDPTHSQLGVDFSRVANQADGFWDLFILEFIDHGHSFFESVHHHVNIAGLKAPPGAVRVDFDDQPDAFVHRNS